MAVEPKIIVGDPVTGLGGDNLRQAFSKYNIHTHGRVIGSCYNFGFRPQMVVEIRSENGTILTTAGVTTIVEVGIDFIKIDRPIPVGENLTVQGLYNTTNNSPQLALAEKCSTSDGYTIHIPPVGGEVPATLARECELKICTGKLNLEEGPKDYLVTFITLPGSDQTEEVRTPIPNSTVQPVLVAPPFPVVLHQIKACLTCPSEVDPQTKATLRLRKNQTRLPGTAHCYVNQIQHDSTITYTYTPTTNIVIDQYDIVYAVVKWTTLPPKTWLSYTLSLVVLV